MEESMDTQNLPPLAQIKQLISPGARYWNRLLPEDDSLHGYAAALQNSHEFILCSLEEYSSLQPSPVTAEWAQGALGARFHAYRWGERSLPSLCHPSLTTCCELASGIDPTFTAKELVKTQDISCAATHSRYTYTADFNVTLIQHGLYVFYHECRQDKILHTHTASGLPRQCPLFTSVKKLLWMLRKVCPFGWTSTWSACCRSAGDPQGFQIHWSQ